MAFFELENLIADELTSQDAEDFHKICNQPHILQWMNDWEMTIEQVEDLLSYIITGYKTKSPEEIPFIMAIRTTRERQLIGICGFGPKEELGGDVEIAYFIDEAHAGKGYMNRVVEKAVDFYFDMTKKPYLCALVDENNIPSMKILLKNGFVYHKVNDPNGILKSHYRHNRNYSIERPIKEK